MTFLELRPYIRVGDTIGTGFTYENFKATKGLKVTQQVHDNLYKNTTPIRLRVTGTPKVKRELEKKKVKTYNTDGKSTFAHYWNGDGGHSFKVKCIISQKDRQADNKTVYYYLNYLYTIGRGVSVVADTEIIPNGLYQITDFTDFDMIRKDYYEVEIEFTKFTTLTDKLTNVCTVRQSKLKACKRPSTKKVWTVNQIKKKKAKAGGLCLGYVNELLYVKGYYGKGNKKRKSIYNSYKNYWTKYSVSALKRFQTKWNKQGLKPKLNTKGKLDKNTWNALKRYPEVK